MEVALRRRLDGVARISISQREQTAEVTFVDGDHAWSPEEFRKAVGEAGVAVVTFQVDACGLVEDKGGERWFAAGRNRWRLAGERPLPAGQRLCLSGRLDDSSRPPTYEVLDVRSTRP